MSEAVYTVVKFTGEKDSQGKKVYDLLVQEGGHSELPTVDSDSMVKTEIVYVKNPGQKSESDYWPRGPWNTEKGAKGEIKYL